MAQSKFHSKMEVVVNTILAMVTSFMLAELCMIYIEHIQHYIYPEFVYSIDAKSNLILTVVITVISLIRTYIVRRVFNKWET